ncbi:MAG: molybdopterin cofactor-binding domain-containing protein [Pseudomonadota bacterium]
MGIAKIARRTFLIGAAAVAGGVAVGYYYVQKPYENPLKNDLSEGESTFNPYVKISKDNEITIIAPRAEMGQGIHTTLAALVAEELDVSLEQIKVEHGPGDFAYYNDAMLAEGGPFPFFEEGFVAQTMSGAMRGVSKVLGLQVTGGSSSIKDGYDKMRKAGCAARHLLIAAAAKKLEVPAENLRTANKLVIDPETNRSFTYGELAEDAAQVEPPSDMKLRDPSEWKLLGKSPQRVDIPAKVTGAPIFGIDVELPEMVHATVKMSPRFWAKAKSVNKETALAVPGVRDVVELETTTGSGFGIIADHTWAAFKGAEALEVEWEDASYPADSESMFEKISEALDTPADQALRDDGDVETAFADAPREELLDVEYRVPWLAHACLEPMNATAQWKDGVLDIWAPTQAPTILQMVCASLVEVESKDVRVHTTMLGGGFGRRGEIDFVIYAVELAKRTNGKPVKVTWTREEDTRHDTYRPAAIAKMRARVPTGQMPEAVDMHIAVPSILKSVMARTFPSISPSGPDKILTEGAFDQPYKIDNYRVQGSEADLPIPVGFWRSVGNSCNAWFHESFMDEIAEKAQLDPLEMRLELMKDYPAAIGVVRKVADMSNWGAPMSQGKGKGFAHCLSFGTWVAMVVEVETVDEEIKISNVWAACELGKVLDPQIVKAQIMSSVVFGLSSAMGQAITFENGEVVEGNFYDYDFMRMSQCPQIHVELLESYHKMGGAGEPGMPPTLPALANAIYQAGGTRIRSMPLSDEVSFAV